MLFHGVIAWVILWLLWIRWAYGKIFHFCCHLTLRIFSMEEIYSHENKTLQNNDSAMEQFILCILSKLNKIRYFILKWVIHSFAMMIVKLTLSNIKRLKINVRLLLDINFETLDILSRLNKRGLTFFAFQIWLIYQVGYHIMIY